MPTLAQKLIAENKRTRATSLDLGNCGLKEIPTELGELLWLESLSFASEWTEWDGNGWQRKESENKRGSNLFKDLSALARLTSLQSLNISAAPVSDLSPLAGLTSLRSLNLSNTQISDLSHLSGLTSLQALNLSCQRVHDLNPLAYLTSLQSLDVSYTQVNDLTPLANLTALQSLFVFSTQVTDLSPLANLSFLQLLNASGTQVSNLKPLANLTSLQTLIIPNTQVIDLSPLAGLTFCRSVHASRTQVSDLKPLANLTSLQILTVWNTAIRSLLPLLELIRQGLPVKWSSNSWQGRGIYVENCPLTDPPPGVVAQGNEAILNYFDEKARGPVDRLYEAKMLVLGEGGAGKTSLVRRLFFRDMNLPDGTETTRGIEIHRKDFVLKNGRTFRLNVWDFGGQQVYHATHQFFLTSRSLYVLLDDTLKDHKSVSDEGFRYWLELIDVFGGHSPTLIFQNQKGGRSKNIDFPGIVQKYDNVKAVFQGNLEHAGAADRLRNAIEYFATSLEHIGEELPASWIKVRADIEQLAQERSYVDVDEYFKIYARHLEMDRTKAHFLSRYLHDLGVFLHFQDDALLRRTVILQNEWATTAVFRVLDDEAVKGKFGRFDEADCARLWKSIGYDHMHPELLALMQKFELCYAVRDSERPTWLAPQLLPASKPKELKDWARGGDLILRYKYVFLPKGVISRMTVRQHRYVRDPEKAWVTGVLFEQGKSEVLMEVLPHGNEIELRAQGPENKALLSVISADLDALNDSFKGLREKIEKRIPCICKACRGSDSPHFYDYRKLLERKENGKRNIECERPPYEEVEVVQLLEGVKKEAPEWAKGEAEVTASEIRVFLASSSELRKDRDAFHFDLDRLNEELRKQGLHLRIVRWEYFLDAISETRLQDEYNKEVRKADVFVSLFFTKAGKFTEEEFDAAYGEFKTSGRPLVYTYFKNASANISKIRSEDLASREKFIAKLKGLGHFPTEYSSTDKLKLHFRSQVPMIRERLGL